MQIVVSDMHIGDSAVNYPALDNFIEKRYQKRRKLSSRETFSIYGSPNGPKSITIRHINCCDRPSWIRILIARILSEIMII
ncbi:MAG: hypothetical protein C4B59_00200 [Candidatus Methanogaster sp.]|uniref:Uncharacterized protein n=1 Tax=Candidatus Methanogaster sp. TaxID=3386292 RepID=A0AC61L6R4_9EURY|nr:MAG: hypothetical protein C4B59_00200 [ANME-2 cluster archaeon]